MKPTILITGGAGFIGSHTVDLFLAMGSRVIAVDNLRTGKRENLAIAAQDPRFSFEFGDVSDAGFFNNLVAATKPDVIVHLAALVSVQESIADPALNDRLNRRTSGIIADLLRRGCVRRIVFASTAAVYGDPASVPIMEDSRLKPMSPYGQAKLDSERLLLDSATGSNAVVRVQRYFNVYGPRQDPRSPYSGVISIFLDHLNRGEPPTIFGDGYQTRDFVHVSDVARANVIAALREPLSSGVANICTGRSTTIRELWRKVSGGPESKLVPRYAPERAGDIRDSCGSPALAQEQLGFLTEVSLADGLRSFAHDRT